jgi:hypothetical protein
MMRPLHEVPLGKTCLRFLILCGILIATFPAFAGTSASVLPTGLSYAPQKSGTVSGSQTFTVYNLGTTNITVTSISSSIAQFVASGTVPVTILPAKWANFTVTFNPSTAKAYSGQINVTIAGLPVQKVTLNGTGTSSTAIATLSQKSLTFPGQSVGSSASQALTITNTGTTSFKVTSVTLTYPFSQTGFNGTSTSIAAGKSLTMQVAFFPTATGVTNGSMQIVYDSLAPAGVTLSGTGNPATSLTVSSYPALPSATQNAAYQATLTAAGGVGPYSWALASGSTLPSGLSLSSSGAISGTLASTVAIGGYSFTAKVTDSHSATASAPLTLGVYAVTGSKCNNVTVNAADGTGPLVPINDLGAGSYLGAEEGGLYANGSNVRPSDHDTSGVALAQQIQPLDSNGNPSPTGKYVFIAIGESIAQQPFFEFTALAEADPSVNSNLVIVNGATGGATASLLALPNNNFWNVINNNYLPNAGVTAKQVVAAWVNDVNGGPAGTFPSDMTKIQGNFESLAQNLLIKFPNIRIAYFSSINYTGYSDGLKNLSNEPYSYETGFAVKNAIQDQINGNANLNFDPTKGKVLAPWIDWGPYYWTNGMLPRSDGLVWTCQDAQADGTHPSTIAGRVKVSTELLNFLKSDDTSTVWFLNP